MIFGNPSVFAIESQITGAYERLSFRALGFFVIHVGGQEYGVRKADATMLACSFDEVERRIAARGTHAVSFAESDAGRIVHAFVDAKYSELPDHEYLGVPLGDVGDAFDSARIVWAPDGDEAFDDGSYVLQFDVGNRVRLIAFKRVDNQLYDPSTLNSTWLPAEEFYRVLQLWHAAFLNEWQTLPKKR